ncbi:MAG: type II toxin-antitoxin system PemK/MazF family toxin [Actinomycetota bacterium]|nr:type II toxin-antitoxin system PemK/MazF family toxin [Actinomycetota bacterium]
MGVPRGSEAGLERPAIVVTADRILRARPSVIQVVPLTRTLRGYESEVTVEPDDVNGLDDTSAAQCQHIRAVATSRLGATLGNVGSVVLAQVRVTLAVLLDCDALSRPDAPIRTATIYSRVSPASARSAGRAPACSSSSDRGCRAPALARTALPCCGP